MAAKIIVVVNQKGGSGKTTLSMQLAGTLGLRGYRILVVDADSQGTATRWAASSEDDTPFPATVAGLAPAGGKIHREVKKYMADYEYIIVDCPPSVDSPVPQSALLIADLALVPVVPSPADLWAARGIKQLIENAENINEDLDVRLIANMVQPRTTLGKDALEILDDFGIPLTDSSLHLRTVYRESTLYGSTVHIFGSRARPAIKEIESLTDELLKILS